MTVDSTIEFSVNFAGPSSVQETEDALKGFPGIRKFKISLKQESLTVTTTLPTAEVQKRIEAQTGLRAVVVGMGGDKEALPGKTKGLGAAVAAVGGALGAGSVQGSHRWSASSFLSCFFFPKNADFMSFFRVNFTGVVRFVQLDSDNCLIDGTIDGLTPGEHALAVHECGDLSGGCQSVGPHFNPRSV